MTKIHSVEKVELALNKSNPPALVVTAYGKTNTGGWTDIRVQPLWNRTHPPKNGVYKLAFTGTRPAGPAPDVMTEVGPASYTFTFEETYDAKKITVYADTNSKSEDWNTNVDPGFGPHAVLNTPRTAAGYSNTWNLGEALQNAITNLPPDDNPFPDKLYQFTISIGAEVGGIAGLNRMKVTISG